MAWAIEEKNYSQRRACRLVGMAPRLDDKGDPDPKLPKRPAYAVGSIDLSIPPRQRTLAVEVKPSVAKLGPGEGAKLGIAVKDAAGRPVPDAEVAVIAVDFFITRLLITLMY